MGVKSITVVFLTVLLRLEKGSLILVDETEEETMVPSPFVSVNSVCQRPPVQDTNLMRQVVQGRSRMDNRLCHLLLRQPPFISLE